MAEETGIPDAYLIEIGRVAVAWGVLENVITAVLISLLNLSTEDPRGHALFAHMAYPQKIQTLGSIIGELELPADHPFLGFKPRVLKLLEDASKARNKIMHQKWIARNGAVLALNTSARGKLEFKHERITVEGLQEAVLLITLAAEELLKMCRIERTSAPQTGQ